MLGMILAVVLLIDLVAASAAYLIHHDDPVVLPAFALQGAPHEVAAPAAQPPEELATVDQVRSPAPQFRPGVETGPASLALAAARAARRYVDTRDPSDLKAASAALHALAEVRQDGLLPHRYPSIDLHGDRMPNVWYSAETQGLALSAASLVARETGRESWIALADSFFHGLLHFRDFARFGRPAPGDPWVSFVDDSGFLWFEEFPSRSPPSLSMTAHLTALFGVYDFWSLSHEDAAKSVFRGGVATVRRYLSAVRVPGGVCRNGLPIGIRDIVQHRLLIRQLHQLAKITSDFSYAEWAALFARDLAEPSLPRFVVHGELPRGDVDPWSPLPAVYGYRTGPSPGTEIRNGKVLYQGSVSPEASAAYALAALDRYKREADPVWLDRAETAVRHVLDNSVQGLYRHDYSARSIHGPLSPPWYSGSSQGLMLGALVQLARITEKPSWRERADDAFLTLLRFRDEHPGEFGTVAHWTSLLDDDRYVWFEKYPDGAAPTFTIDAHIATSFAVYDYWRLTDSSAAARLFAGGATTIKHYLPRIRVPGGLSHVGVSTSVQDRRSHHVVTRQLLTLARLTGDPALAAAAEAFASDA